MNIVTRERPGKTMDGADGRRLLVLAVLLMVVAVVGSSLIGGPLGSTRTGSVPTSTGISSTSVAFGIPIGLFSPFDYAVIPPGTPVFLNLSAGGFTSVQTSLDGGPFQPLAPPYVFDTNTWTYGMRTLRVQALSGTAVVGTNSFVFFADPSSAWPPDTMTADVVLIGFDVDTAQFASQLLRTFFAPTQLTSDPSSQYTFEMKFSFRVSATNASYTQAFLSYIRSKARFEPNLHARLNLAALIDQRDNGTRRDIFDPLMGWQIRTEAAEEYLAQNPPLPAPTNPGFTYYVMNLTALDNPTNGTQHWFVRPTPDPDTGVDENWWRLEWDNPLNTPMGFPMNAFGGSDRKVFLDPTAYQWYLDWSYVWWQGGNGPAPFGQEYQDVPAAQRASYLAGLINDLNAGLATELPIAPPQEPTIEIRTFVLSGSTNYTLNNLRWVYNETLFGDYLRSFLPYKTIEINTTFASIDAYPSLKATVDANTSYSGGWGFIDGVNVWTYLVGNRSLYAAQRPNVIQILTIALLYDNRSMVVTGREFTGLGGDGVTAIFMNTGRLYYPNGTREKGLTSIIAHEAGHNFGYGHQFGPNYRADFIDGNMGYFRVELVYGTFYEDALYRVYDREKLLHILQLLEPRWPVDLQTEFIAFYLHYRRLDLLGAYADLRYLEQELTDGVLPTANAGGDRTVPVNEEVTLDASASTDNSRVVNYSWDFGDGTSLTVPSPYVTKMWTKDGVYTVTLTVTDVAGNRATARILVTVGNAIPIWVWIVTAAGAVVAAVPAAVLVRRWRRRKAEQLPPTGPAS